MIVAILAAAAAAAAHAPTQPDPAVTPGVWRPMTAEQVCSTKWGLDHRAVTSAMKLQVFRAYGFTGNDDPRCDPAPGSKQRCEIDHRFTRELGGADDVANLWPQAYAGPWNAHDKDRLENWAHARVCDRSISIDQARALFEGDWHDAYLKAFGAPPASVTGSATAPPADQGD